MDVIQVRPVRNREELEVCFDLWATVFPDGRSFFQERLDFDSTYRFDTTWVATVNDVIASSIQLFPYHSWIGGVPVKVGGIGNVATLQHYRGRGLAQAILRQQSAWMKRNGFDLSVLFTGIYSFYEQVGWHQVPGSNWVLDVAEVLRLTESTPAQYAITAFSAEYLPDIQTLYEASNAGQTNVWQRSTSYWTEQLCWRRESADQFLVARSNQHVVGYVRSRMNKEGQLQIGEICYEPESRSAVTSLVRAALLAHPTARTLHAHVPTHHELSRMAPVWGGRCEDFPYAMWKIIDVSTLLARLEALLSARLAAHDNLQEFDGRRTLVRCNHDEQVLSVREGQVHLTSVGEALTYHDVIEFSPGQLVTLLTQGVSKVADVALRDHPLLRALFPEQPSILWQTDFF